MDNAQINKIGRQCDIDLQVVPPGAAGLQSLKHIRDEIDGHVQPQVFVLWHEIAMDASKPLPDNQTYPLYFF